MASFDIVSELDWQEVDNAVNQVAKEIGSRFDFRGGKSSIELAKEKKLIKILADDEMKLRSIHQILESKMARRSLDCRALKYGDVEEAGGKTLRQQVELKVGISKDEAKKITKLIKESKLKVQPQIQGDQVRITGKKIDDLQSIIGMLKESDIGIPMQYVNMRS